MKDNRIVLRVYACVAGIGGAIVALFHTESFAPVFGAALLASGCWAAMLSQLSDPELRRKGVRWFAAAHFVVLVILRSQMSVEFFALFFVILSILAASENSFLDRDTGAPLAVVSYERQIRQAGAQEERNRLARDLHDSIKQQIFVIQTAAATAQTRFDSDREGAAAALDQIRTSARDAMTEMEVMMDQLRSVPLENTGLVEALKKQCEALGHRTGARVEFTLGELPANNTIIPGAHQTILRVAQEACANIGRHARANNVSVSLGSVNGQLELRIQDDGAGFQPMLDQSGMGIANMRERAKELGGNFSLTSHPGNGTTVTFTVPRNMTPGHGGEYTQQGLVFAATFAAVVAFLPPKQRTFAACAWSLAGAFRVFQWIRARRRLTAC